MSDFTSNVGFVSPATTFTATGTTQPYDLGRACQYFTLQTTAGGTVAPTAVSVVLEGSLDGATWTTLATSTTITSDQQYSTGKPETKVRARLATLTGGTAPTVTVLIAASA